MAEEDWNGRLVEAAAPAADLLSSSVLASNIGTTTLPPAKIDVIVLSRLASRTKQNGGSS